MGVWVIAAYRPHGGKVREFESLLRDQMSVLRVMRFVSEAETIVLRSPSGVYLEIFEWASRESIEAAHDDDVVHEMWSRFESVCDYVRLADMSEMGELFPEFERMKWTRPMLAPMDDGDAGG
jgi:hypothetical protein